MRSSASITLDKLYRYDLHRSWGPGGRLLWCLLNPSTADADEDDPTVRRVRSFTTGWGFSGFTMVNLFAWRSTNPKKLKAVPDPVGPDNLSVIARHLAEHRIMVAAWGVGVTRVTGGASHVLPLVRDAGVEVWCLGLSAKGHPRHPGRVRRGAAHVPWETGDY